MKNEKLIKPIPTFLLHHQMRELKTSVQDHLTTGHKKDMKTLLAECFTI